MENLIKPSLFGITNSNRDFSDPYYWGKNQFNSSFPVALACYMRSCSIPLVYVTYRDELRTSIGELEVSELFGSNRPNSELYFAFESRFDPFLNHVHDELPPIDLVVCDGIREHKIRPLEIKLTTLPDNTTESLGEDKYGSELVIRSATTRYMALSMVCSLQKHLPQVREIFEPVMAKVRNWDSKPEMLQLAPRVLESLQIFLNEFKFLQTPLMMQPIWKTIGKTPVLTDNCLDIFVWSDFALTHLFLDSALNSLSDQDISNKLGVVLRISRFIYQSSLTKLVYQAPIFGGMLHDCENGKGTAFSAADLARYMTCERLRCPSISKNEIKKIVLGGGHKFLTRKLDFDEVIFFSNELFEPA